MLVSLDIRDLLIIDHLALDFRAGLNVLTGETGAGKSILLDSLGFVLGWRGRAELVRQGAERGEVTAVFDIGDAHPARDVLAEAGLPAPDEGQIILRRITTPEGRKTAWINDRRASGEVLRQLSETLVELHGQHDDRGLLNPRGHRGLLDAYAGSDADRKAVRAAWAALREGERDLEKAQAAQAALREEEDFLRHAVAELDELEPQAGEDAELDTRRRAMQAGQRIGEDIRRAHAALGGDGAEGAIGDAARWLEGVAGDAEGLLEEPMAALMRAMTEVGEAADGIERALNALDSDPSDLEQVEERLFAIRALARKHQVTPEDLPALATELRGRLDALDAGDGDLARLRAELAAAKADYDKAAHKLSETRRKAAKRLDKAVMAELAPLKMERAVFTTDITSAEPGPEGTDAVAFTVATNPGAPAGLLNKIASGGELSRFLLALKVCLRTPDESVTMIFDEIDRGVGGATADAVGRRLAALAAGGQVLVVTHSPQVAARGAAHWRVEKRVSRGAALTHVAALTEAERVDEIARMVAGDRITDAAREAARALLDD